MLEASLLITAFALAGAISASLFFNRISRIKTSLKKYEHPIKPFSTTKEELESLLFEKSLISHSITRVYEASYEGKIDSIERDRLLLKYKQQLDSYNKKIADLQSLVDIAELAEMRNGLVSLLEGKITAIDQRLAEISNKYGISTSDIIIDSSKGEKQAIADKIGEEQQKNKKRGNNNNKEEEDKKKMDKDYDQMQKEKEYELSSDVANGKYVSVQEQKDKNKKYCSIENEEVKIEEKTIEELQKEIMYALSRLEQVNSNDGYEDNDLSVSSIKRDALSSFS